MRRYMTDDEQSQTDIQRFNDTRGRRGRLRIENRILIDSEGSRHLVTDVDFIGTPVNKEAYFAAFLDESVILDS